MVARPGDGPSILAAGSDRSMLTVTEVLDLAAAGGMINFTRRDNRVHFEVNLDAIDRAGLKICSKLLRVATIVRE